MRSAPPPLIMYTHRNTIIKHLLLSFATGYAVAEVYWRFWVIPRRNARDAYNDAFGIEGKGFAY